MLNFNPIKEDATIGGHRFTVSALPMGVLRREVMPLIESGQSIMEGGGYDKVLNVCHMGVSQADPSVTVEGLENALMLADLVELFHAVVRVSGLSRSGPEGEAKGQGQAAPVSGPASMASLPQQPDGHTAISTPS